VQTRHTSSPTTPKTMVQVPWLVTVFSMMLKVRMWLPMTKTRNMIWATPKMSRPTGPKYPTCVGHVVYAWVGEFEFANDGANVDCKDAQASDENDAAGSISMDEGRAWKMIAYGTVPTAARTEGSEKNTE